MNVRLTHIDGKLPNVALMRLAAHLRAEGHAIHFTRDVTRGLFEPDYDRVFASTIFTFSQHRVDRFLSQFPEAIIGGTGSGCWTTLEDKFPGISNRQDYSLYPRFRASIGFLSRGCRLRCKFCVVPQKEGRPQANMTVDDLWRGPPYPKTLHLLDNDFFGLPDWRQHVANITRCGFRVCFNQGINIRMVTEETADALASIEYRDDQFRRRRLYTAWDNLRDEGRFFSGVDALERAGIPPHHLLVYMLVGYDPAETWERIEYRFRRMVDRGILPYPMVYGDRPDLKRFQRYVVRGLYKFVTWADYRASGKPPPSHPSLPL